MRQIEWEKIIQHVKQYDHSYYTQVGIDSFHTSTINNGEPTVLINSEEIHTFKEFMEKYDIRHHRWREKKLKRIMND